MRRLAIAIAVSALFAASIAGCRREAPQAPAPAKPQPAATAEARIEADVRTLAADDMEGRETGTRGYDKAADYVAARMQAVGLQPAGDSDGWFQQVPLLKATREQAGARLAILHPQRAVELRFKDQFLPSANYDAAASEVTAPAVFVGYGVHAPELQQDDFAGLDLKGKIAVLFNGAPARFDNDRRAYYSSTREKLRAVAERGAVGAVFVSTAEEEARSPWARGAENWQRPGMRLRSADGKGIDTFPQLRVVASVAAAAADFVFEGSGHFAPELFKAAGDGTLKGFALPSQLALAARTRIEPVQSRNVVGKVAGSDATLAAEHVVYTAHLDHVGIGAPVKGDKVYNGALDNALGVAIMLEAARELVVAKPKRSALFIALTAEEKGLLGAEWFASSPTVPKATLIANINLDMPVLLAPSKDVVPIGVEHSSLKAVLDAAAKEVGVAISPDPFPEETIFVRSDQYPFIRAGIPAVYLIGGIVSADGKRDPKLAFGKFLREHYHQPSDQVDLPIAWGDAARMARLNARIGRIVGDAPQRPRWNPGDFFGDKFAK